MGIGDEANSKILDTVEDDIDALLSDKQASTDELARGILRILKTQNPYLIQSLADHKRTMTMWATYRFMAWAMSALGVMLLGLLFGVFTGKVELIFK
jgi:hypothetical protein